MKITTNFLKEYLAENFQCSPKTIKRISKSKNEQKQIIRKFETDKGIVLVTTNSDDNIIIKCKVVQNASSNGFYFCFSPTETKEYRKHDYAKDYNIFLITPSEYYDREGYLSDRGNEVPLNQLDDQFEELMESVFETSLSKEEAEDFLLSKGFVENRKMLNN